MTQLSRKIKINKKWKIFSEKFQCHLDPDLIKNIYPRKKGWKPLFGQMGNSQAHLKNKGIKEKDIFLFFGLFQKTKINDEGTIIFNSSHNPVHVIFGYLQVGKIYKITTEYKIPNWMHYHPHCAAWRKNKPNNVIYEAIDQFTFNPVLPGAGALRYSDSLVLTKKGMTASRWDLPKIFKNVFISYHSNSRKYGWQNGYFQAAQRGQEFVIEENKHITDWAKTIISEYYK